ncbi:MAG: MFS transporter [Nitrososphaerota archaeon]
MAKSGGARSAVLLGLLLGIFLAAIDATVVSVAMPRVVSSLGGVSIYSWVFTAYILASTISGPLWGRISDIYGRRVIYMAGVALFILGSALCGVAADMTQLVVFRALQGVGAGSLLVLTFTLIGELYRLEERARITGYTTSVWAIASIIGPPLGGFLVDSLDWRWIFFINIPFGLASISIAWQNLTRGRGEVKGLDVVGTILFAVASTTLLIYINEYNSLGMLGGLMLPLSLAIFPAFIYVERRASNPLIPLNLFKDKVLRGGYIGNLTAGFIFFGSIAYLPLYLQWAMNLTATTSGLALLPTTFGWLISANLAARLVVSTSPKPLAISSGLALIIGTAAIAVAADNLLLLLTALGLLGVGMGFTVSTFLITTQTVVERRVLGVATSLLSFLRTFGGAVAAAVMWIPLSGVMGSINSSPSPSPTPTLTTEQIAAFKSAISLSFIIALAVAVSALAIYLYLPSIKLRGRQP